MAIQYCPYIKINRFVSLPDGRYTSQLETGKLGAIII